MVSALSFSSMPVLGARIEEETNLWFRSIPEQSRCLGRLSEVSPDLPFWVIDPGANPALIPSEMHLLTH